MDCYRWAKYIVTVDDQVKAYIKRIMAQLNKWMTGGKISKLVIVITSKETGENVERWQFDVCFLSCLLFLLFFPHFKNFFKFYFILFLKFFFLQVGAFFGRENFHAHLSSLSVTMVKCFDLRVMNERREKKKEPKKSI